MKTVSCCIAALLLFAFPADAQNSGQVPYIETLEVRVHSIDVVVTDAKGVPVTGLGQSDFELFENGVAKPITNFSAFAEARAEDVAVHPGAHPAAAATPEKRPPRKLIFYVDEMAMLEPTQKKLQTQVERLLDTVMEDGDEAMVLRPAEEKKLAAPFTSDREAIRRTLRQAIASESWRAGGPIFHDLRQFEIETRNAASPRERRLAFRRWAGSVRMRVQQRLGQLQAAVNAVSEVEGRKVLILVTESLPIEPGREAFASSLDPTPAQAGAEGSPFGDWNVSDIAAADWVDLTPLVEQIARTAATNGISIYSVQAEYGIGSFTPGGDIAATARHPAWDDPTASAARPNASVSRISGGVSTAMANDAISNTGRSLRLLAQKTGGKAYVGAGTFDDLVNGIASDVRSYYSIGFRADASVDTATRIEVRVKGRPDLRIRTRREVIRKSPEREMTDRVVARLIEPDNTVNELGLQLQSKLVGVAADRSSRTYWIAVRVPMSALTFVPDGDTYKARFTVHYAAMGQDADFVSGTAEAQVVDVPAAKFQASRAEQYTYVVPMNLRPAKHRIAIGVLDSISHLSGFATTEIDAQ